MAKVNRPPFPLPSLPLRIIKLHTKLAIAILIGIVVAFAVAPLALQWGARILAGWDLGVAVYLVLTLSMMWRADVAHIRRRASEQDEGAAFILLLSIVATFASLVAVVIALGGAKQGTQGNTSLHVALAFTTILLSWAFVHTIFSFHYAHEYYGERRDGKIGGLHFPDDREPDYRDFLYFSLVIGMTSQVSDVAISSKVIRRVASLHGVLSFFFNLVVLALTVNMVANLI
ncbi:MAG TPA: DUF1345 domain-containing protein [Pseudolabrys sp.]|nr:DUF1345 domain-containing protein [Pseudolabrys sp.]